MEIKPIAFFHSSLTSKFGIPRQSGLANELQGQIVFEPEYQREEAVRGLEQFDYLWLIWEFSANPHEQQGLTVRPPRLGGNERVGVFASRSPFRPNRLGLSCVYINKVEMTRDKGPVIHVKGADLMDGTPIYDIKPYLSFSDSHPEAVNGFAEESKDYQLTLDIEHCTLDNMPADIRRDIAYILRQDPRPAYHDDPEREYKLEYAGYTVTFCVNCQTVEVKKIEKTQK